MADDRTARRRRIRWDLFDAVNGAETPERIREDRRRRRLWIAFSVLGVVVFGAASVVSS